MKFITPPDTEKELLSRCQAIAGRTLEDLVSSYHQPLPTSLHYSKGFIGQLIEWHLGAQNSNQPSPDFPKLGIELKTLPLNANGQPRESTYVCTAPVSIEANRSHWATSRVREKLLKVLWVPVEADPNLPLSKRRIGMPLLWNLDKSTEAILKEDWEELSSLLQMGQITELSGRRGTYLQIRPKAAHSHILVPTTNDEGESIMINPKGFYLRTLLTQKILDQHYTHSL